MIFRDREFAGRLLANKLLPFASEDTIVVALPRGGLPVAKEVAKRLNAPLDIFFVKKIPSPYNKEAAIGAVSENGYYYIDPYAKNMLNVTDSYIDENIKEIKEKIEDKRAIYNKPRLSYKDKRIILIDDGVATGASMMLAIKALRAEGAKEVIVAAPVAPVEVASKLRGIADKAVFLDLPSNFMAVGQFYEDFHQLTDEEVMEILKEFE